MSDLLTDITINNFIGKINTFLSLYDVCFIGGAFVFEDNHADLYNLLTYNTLDDSICGSTNFPSKQVSYKQSKTHGIFLSRFSSVKCVPRININLPGCKPDKCVKFERIINLENICSMCKYKMNYQDHTKRVALYYPFYDNRTNKRYLYLKLESHPMISTGHAIEASKTYILKTKIPERRENDSYTSKFQNMDTLF